MPGRLLKWPSGIQNRRAVAAARVLFLVFHYPLIFPLISKCYLHRFYLNIILFKYITYFFYEIERFFTVSMNTDAVSLNVYHIAINAFHFVFLDHLNDSFHCLIRI